jgi:uncharacterized membrane protein (UPF0127 family)
MARLTSPARASVPLIPALLALAACACERPVAEPQPEAHPITPAAQTAAPPVTPSAAPTAAPVTPTATAVASPEKPPAGRCVRQTPKTPERKAPPSPDPRCPPDVEKPPTLRTAKVIFGGENGTAVTVEVADNDHDRQRGLMFRKSMPQDHGMIFRFAEKDNHAFWMHNTCIPLDMLYIDDDGFIVGIEENTPTMSDDTFEVGCESRYVLELNAGWARAHGVAAGQKLKIDGL